MNLVIFGATGGTGRQIVEQALRAGHTVRALVRTPAKARLPDAVQIVRGDILDAEAVAQTVEGTDAVLSSLGARLTATFTRRGRILSAGMVHIVDAMRAHGVRRLIAVSTYGVGDSRQRLGFGARLVMGGLLYGELADKNAMEVAIRASGLDWTIIRPVNLKDGPPTGRMRVDQSTRRVGFSDWISRGDVAAAMLAAIDDRSSIGRTQLITQE